MTRMKYIFQKEYMVSGMGSHVDMDMGDKDNNMSSVMDSDMSELMDEWIGNDRIYRWISEWIMNDWRDGWMNKWMNYEWLNGWMD